MKNVTALLAIAALFVGCAPTQPPAPPPSPAPTAATPPPTPPPPEPPKCAALSESCTGQGGTHARIRQSGMSIIVPDGWAYAQQDDATVTTSNTAAAAVTTYDGGADAKAMEANRDTAFAALVTLLGVTSPKHKVAWAHPKMKSKVGDLDMALWQADDVTKADKKGSVLVFGTQLPDKSWLLGAGFVETDDASDADKAILAAIHSIAPTPPAASP